MISKIFLLIKLIISDRKNSKKKPLHFYGLFLITGIYGSGKTLYMTHYLLEKKKQYGDKVYVATNYGLKGEDFKIRDYHDLLYYAMKAMTEKKPLFVGYDELQNDFNSRAYKDFPINLVRLLTQNRKNSGVQILGTVLDTDMSDVTFMRLADSVIECKTWFKRLTIATYYDKNIYKNKHTSNSIKNQKKLKSYDRKFVVQTDELRNSYDSFQLLQTFLSDYIPDIKDTL